MSGERFVQLPMNLRERPEPPLDERQQRLHEALRAYNLNTEALRNAAQLGQDLNALLRTGEAPEEVHHLITALSALLRPGPREQIKSPADAAVYLRLEMSHLQQEHFRVLNLDTKNRIQEDTLLYIGTKNTAYIDTAEVFSRAVMLKSAAILCAHCHPSGDVTPSPEDISITREIVSTGSILHIDVLDHIIVGKDGWTSLREKGFGFSK